MRNSPHVHYNPARKRAARSAMIVAGWACSTLLAQGVTDCAGQPPRDAQTQAEAEIATLDGGRQVTGRLDVSVWPIVFRPRTEAAAADSGAAPLSSDAAEPIAVTQLRRISFPATGGRPPEPGRHERLYLAGRQRVAGHLIRIEGQNATISVFGNTARDVPRAALVAAAWCGDAIEPGCPAIHRRQDSAQDAAILRGTDEIYGRLVEYVPPRVRLSGLFGETTVEHSLLGAISLRNDPLPVVALEGLIVRAWFLSPAAELTEPLAPHALDCLEGELLAAGDDNNFAIRHAYLGRVNVARPLMRRLEVLHSGRRFEIDPRYHHLGNESRAEFDVVQPEGTWFEATFSLSDVPAGGVFIRLMVVEAEGQDAGAKYRDQIMAGHLRTTLLVNGRALDYVNRHVRHASSQPREIRIPLPPAALSAGENTIRIEQTPQQDNPDEYDDCGIYGLALEIEPPP